MDQQEAKKHFLGAYDTHADELYRFCLLKVSSGERAQDFLQDVFTRYWQVVRGGTIPDNPRAYLYTLARNRITDWYRKKKSVSLDAMTDSGFDFEGTSGNEIVRDAETRELLAAINELDEPSRAALVLRFVEGWTPKEIAAYNEETPNAVSVRINRSLAKVRSAMRTEES